MVTGIEYIFSNIDEALRYVLETEQRILAQDPYRQEPPVMMRHIPGMFSQPFSEEIARQAYLPVDSLDYPLSAWFNNAGADKFVMTRLQSGRYSLKPNLRHRKFLFRGESEFHDYVPKFTDEELGEYYAAVHSEGHWQAFCSQIHIPGDKNGLLTA